MSEKLTLTRVLAELKLIDKKIDSATNKKLIGVFQKKSPNVISTATTVENFKKEANESLQAIKDLVDRKEKLKLALSKANSTTLIKVKDRQFTISDAIAFKEAIIPVLEKVYTNINNQYIVIVNQIESNRPDVEIGVQRMLEQNLGADRKIDPDQYNNIAKPFIENNQFNSTDSDNKVKKYIDQLEKDIMDFKSEIDFALSEVNAKTEIEI